MGGERIAGGGMSPKWPPRDRLKRFGNTGGKKRGKNAERHLKAATGIQLKCTKVFHG